MNEDLRNIVLFMIYERKDTIEKLEKEIEALKFMLDNKKEDK